VAQGSTRSDHPAAPPEPSTLKVSEDSGYLWVEGSNSADVSDHATRGYYARYEALRRAHPDLLLELCNDGGRMVDFGSAAHGDYFSITDTYDPLSNRRAFYDASYLLPPAMLESYVAAVPSPALGNFRYMLRSGMLGWFSLMQDASQWNAAQRAAARAEFAVYKSKLRPLIRSADLYHVSARPDGVHWDGIEYFVPAEGRGVLYAFRGSHPGEPTHRFALQGLRPEARYRLHFQDQGAAGDRTEAGSALMDHGLTVSLSDPLSSELVFFRDTTRRGSDATPSP
jgi:alpha-galactosidase